MNKSDLTAMIDPKDSLPQIDLLTNKNNLFIIFLFH
jgi:hypothetical protein